MAASMSIGKNCKSTCARSRRAFRGGIQAGWNVRYTTELTKPVWFYVRGEEYSCQIDHFVQCIKTGAVAISNFRSASDTSLVASSMRADAVRHAHASH